MVPDSWEHEFIMEQAPHKPAQNLSKKHRRATAALEFILVTILSGSIFYEYLHNAFIQSYVKNAIETNAPILQFALPVGLGISCCNLERADSNKHEIWRCSTPTC